MCHVFQQFHFLIFFVNLCLISGAASKSDDFSSDKIATYRQKVKEMFYHAYNGYLQFAYPYDELKPLTCAGMDTWGSFSLTLIDALDTLIILGNFSEFERAANLVLENVNIDANVNVSVFETNIRVIGGLLSAHMLSGTAGVQLEDGWPCYGPLLRLAERMAAKLLPAFNTHTGMPFGTVNLRYGVHRQETPITCTAGVGTFLLEFGALSRLTGNEIFEKVAEKAMQQLWMHRSNIGLLGNHIDVQTGAWTATDSGIGAGVDSYFEYLAKAANLFDKPEWMRQFKEHRKVIEKYMAKSDWFVWVSMGQGQVTMPVFQSLEAFWPGVLTLVGDVDEASRILLNYYQVVKQYGFLPESYNIYSSEAMQNRGGYPLRPEFIESLMYLYRATKDPVFLQIGAQIVYAIESSTKTKCGYATVRDVKDHLLEDRMESFFLAETTKYLYLLFDADNFLHNPGVQGTVVSTPSGQCVVESGGYVFNTEAHPIDPSLLYCCDKRRTKHNEILANFEDNMDLAEMLNLLDDNDKPGFEFAQEEFGDLAEDMPTNLDLYNSESAKSLENDSSPTGDLHSPEDGLDKIHAESTEHSQSIDPNKPELEAMDESSVLVGPSTTQRYEKNHHRSDYNENINSQKSINYRSSGYSEAASSNLSPIKSVEVEKRRKFHLFHNELAEIDVNAWLPILSAQQRKIDILARATLAPSFDSNDFYLDYCSRKDYFSNDLNLDALLNAVYGRNLHKLKRSQCPIRKRVRIEDGYTDAWPEISQNSNNENFTDDETVVSDFHAKTFRNFSHQAEYHFELMCCKPRNFLVKFSSGLGAVAPSSFIK